MKCFYHDDMDGKAAAFVVRLFAWRELSENECQCIPMNYGKPFPIDSIGANETVWIVDYSIQPAEMDALLSRTKDVIWIDHHKTAIEKYHDYDHYVPGLRKDGVAGCVLTWEFCFPGEAIPRAIELVGDRDVWTWAFGEETANFHAGAAMMDTTPTSTFWDRVQGDGRVFAQMLTDGATINAYKSQHYADMLKRIGFEATIDGYECLCMNACGAGSEAFGPGAMDEYPILSPFYWDGQQFTVSLYSNVVDVSEIAKAHGGGGHKGASGFQCATLPYEPFGAQ